LRPNPDGTCLGAGYCVGSRNWKCAEPQPLCLVWTSWTLEDLSLNGGRPTRKASPTITCIRRISAPHARHCMTPTPQSPAYRALRHICWQPNEADCRQRKAIKCHLLGCSPGAAIERKEAVSRAPSEARVRWRKTNPVSLAVFLKWRVIQLARNRNRKEDSSD
jgi:hypothetical protein